MRLDEFISIWRSILLKNGNINITITSVSLDNLYKAIDSSKSVSIVVRDVK